MLGDDVLAHAHLGAKNDVGVLGNRARSSIDLREIDIVEFGDRKSGEPMVGDVHKGIEARPGRRHNEAPEGGDVVGAGIACRNERRCRLVGNEFVGGNADGRAVRKYVRVKVDEPRHRKLTGRGERPVRPRRGDVLRYGFDQPEADANIALARAAPGSDPEPRRP